jgi:hypothetical protein
MSHLKLVVTTPSRKRKPPPPPADTQRPVPTPEFLARRILALPLGELTIEATLAEMVRWLRSNDLNLIHNVSTFTNRLMLVGIHPILKCDDDDPPIHGVVVHPTLLAKRYPELKRVVDQLAGLELMPSAA